MKKYLLFVIGWLFLIAGLNVPGEGKAAENSHNQYTIGLLVMATGPYSRLVEPLLASARKYFCTNHKVTYFVFTNGDIPQADDVIKINQEQMGWPYDTMMRFHTYHKHRDKLAKMDYLFACDADMRFVGEIGNEILGDRVATQHSQLLFKRGCYETNPFSTACVNRHEGTRYFAGAFYGGTRGEFLKLVKTAMDNVNIDLARGVIAKINDESHLNRYFIDHPPTVVLSPSYCHFENWRSPYPKKLIAFDSPEHGKAAMRKKRQYSSLEYFQNMLRETVQS